MSLSIRLQASHDRDRNSSSFSSLSVDDCSLESPDDVSSLAARRRTHQTKRPYAALASTGKARSSSIRLAADRDRRRNASNVGPAANPDNAEVADLEPSAPTTPSQAAPALAAPSGQAPRDFETAGPVVANPFNRPIIKKGVRSMPVLLRRPSPETSGTLRPKKGTPQTGPAPPKPPLRSLSRDMLALRVGADRRSSSRSSSDRSSEPDAPTAEPSDKAVSFSQSPLCFWKSKEAVLPPPMAFNPAVVAPLLLEVERKVLGVHALAAQRSWHAALYPARVAALEAKLGLAPQAGLLEHRVREIAFACGVAVRQGSSF